eukprot:scaffold20682_cov61-Skeletonema_dohrnii-CCMP3373.AAC.2
MGVHHHCDYDLGRSKSKNKIDSLVATHLMHIKRVKMIRLRSPAVKLVWSAILLFSISLICYTPTAAAAAANDEGATTTTDEQPTLITSININLPIQPKRKKRKQSSTTNGGDLHEDCQGWADEGECEANPKFMLENCAASCSDNGATTDDDNDDDDEEEQIIPKGSAHIYEGEDAAMGAFRFAEQYSRHYTNDMIPIPTVLDVARELQEATHSGYTPPNDITHCGGGDATKKSRPCSAGKLWKRAEDMRKADVHDEAGADLIRALLKSGIEVDFKEKCERSLQWALGSVRKQRERERRAALEEA